MIKSHFRIGISNSDSFIDINVNPTTVQRGFKTLIKVQPSATVSDNGIKDLSIEDRKCRFHDEMPKDMSLFQKYSPATCRFECMYHFRYSLLVFSFSSPSKRYHYILISVYENVYVFLGTCQGKMGLIQAYVIVLAIIAFTPKCKTKRT